MDQAKKHTSFSRGHFFLKYPEKMFSFSNSDILIILDLCIEVSRGITILTNRLAPVSLHCLSINYWHLRASPGDHILQYTGTMGNRREMGITSNLPCYGIVNHT